MGCMRNKGVVSFGNGKTNPVGKNAFLSVYQAICGYLSIYQPGIFVLVRLAERKPPDGAGDPNSGKLWSGNGSGTGGAEKIQRESYPE